ncbi:uncharacterized protein LOC114243533 [Bombyx mandarina]|uniref:C-type lectin domain-containing protein n=2 Tax=Bombyx TaxID=7090 RepID=A0A8R1WGG8_BOMMO|nr:uncharacterized protein LOC101742338 [Bombyx mori]XP_028030893.1 uncharacterized protein LOC114243533 [Bombyx mandarina]
MADSERRRLAATAAILLIVFWSQCRGVEAQRNSTKMSYVCPPSFIRLGHSCYFFSDTEATWQKALFACKDRDSNLTVPARWEDKNLRNYLNKKSIKKYSRWIGGIYDSGDKEWKWGGELRKMHYQSFSKMKKMSPQELQWHCIAMIPEMQYRWAPRLCIEPRHYICKTKLLKMPKSKVKDIRRRWQRMGKINEIAAQSVSREVNDPMMVNDMRVNPVVSPKSYDLQPTNGRNGPKRNRNRINSTRKSKSNGHGINELRRRRPVRRRLKRPFPGYTWNRHDPEGSYQRNAMLLRSGRTGLSPQQINTHLARLEHLRNKQLARAARRRRLQAHADDWLVNKPPLAQAHARTYTVNNNISALHPKTIVEEFDMLLPPETAPAPHTPATP